MEKPNTPDEKAPKPRRKIDVTDAKRAANALNAKRSHGALSPETKKRCSMNAL
jgi:hypothetical protein